MNPKEQHEAFKHLFSHTTPDDKAIDAASPEEADAMLAADGTDVLKLNARLAEQKKRLAGKYALVLAHQRRLMATHLTHTTSIPATKEEILTRLREKYGETLPLAAQHCREMSYEELSLLYVDLEGAPPPRSDGK
jgi:hypothetical protein